MAGLRYLANVTTLELDADRCVGCGLCAIVCPHGVFDATGKAAAIVDLDACMECGACARNCPVDAISVQAGVGCATGVIRAALQGGGSTEDCCGKGACCG